MFFATHVARAADETLRLADGTLEGWTLVEGAKTWRVDATPPIAAGNPPTLLKDISPIVPAPWGPNKK